MFYSSNQPKQDNVPAGDDNQFSSSGQNDVIEPCLQEKTVRRTTIILIGAVAFAFLAIWFMNKKATPAPATAQTSPEQLQIEAVIAQLSGTSQQTQNKMDDMVKRFYELSDIKQVSPKQLMKDPFTLSWGHGLIDAKNTSSLDSRQRTGSAGLESLELKSVLESKFGNCCMINDKLLYVGDKIKGVEVVQITADFVRLKSEKNETILRLQRQ